MNSFSELITQRRSMRKFTDELLTPSEVETILRAGLKAPASKSKNPWEFVVIEDKAMMRLLAQCKQHSASFIAEAAVAVVVVADTTKSDVWIEDAAIATIYMQLQAEDLGLGSCWVQCRNRVTESGIASEDYVRQLLGVPDYMDVLAVVAIGHKAQQRKPFDEEKLQWEKVHIGGWQSNEG